LSLVVAAACLAVSQAVPERSLPAAALEFKEGFTGIGAIRELGDGRVLVLDRQDKVVRLVDLTRGTAAPVGRQGGGPGEYRSPSRLIPLGGDSTLLVDPGLQRSIVIGPGGAAGDVLLNSNDMVSAPAGARAPQAVDALGRLYFTGSGLATRTATPTLPDSLLLFRLDRRTGRVDTLARLKQAQPKIRVDRNGTKITSVSIRKVPFTPQDDWAVFPDGRVIIVRTGVYRVDQLTTAGKLMQGPRIPYAPIAVVDADRDSRLTRCQNSNHRSMVPPPGCLPTVGSGFAAPPPPRIRSRGTMSSIRQDDCFRRSSFLLAPGSSASGRPRYTWFAATRTIWSTSAG
jgi:hypothetical protein